MLMVIPAALVGIDALPVVVASLFDETVLVRKKMIKKSTTKINGLL